MLDSLGENESMHALSSDIVIRNQIEALLVGATIRRANVEEIRGLLVSHPPTDEQHEIAEFLVSKTRDLDALSTAAEAGIDLLKERRAALISAAVTGKIDVRGLAADEPKAERFACA